MAGIISRLSASFDRISAWQAFVFMALTGAVGSYVLLGTKVTSQTSTLREFLPIVGFVATVLFALGLVAFSRPIVVRQDKGSRRERLLVKLRDFGTLAAFSAAIAIVIGASTLLAKFATPTETDARVNNLDPTVTTPRASPSTAMADRPFEFAVTIPSSSAKPADSAMPLPSSTSAPSATASATTRPAASVSIPGKLPFLSQPRTKDGKAAPPPEIVLDDDTE